LRDRSSIPLSLPSQTPPAKCAAVQFLRRQRHTGKQIAAEVRVYPATVSHILPQGAIATGSRGRAPDDRLSVFAQRRWQSADYANPAFASALKLAVRHPGREERRQQQQGHFHPQDHLNLFELIGRQLLPAARARVGPPAQKHQRGIDRHQGRDDENPEQDMKRDVVVVIGRTLFQEHAQDAGDQHDGCRSPVHDIKPLDSAGLSRRQLLLQQEMLAEQARDHQHDGDVVDPGDDDGPGQEIILRDALRFLAQKDRAREFTGLN
jgi:hypothetical protein